LILQLKLPTLKYKRLKSDMIEVFKILTGKYDDNVTFIFKKNIKIVEPGGII